MRSLPIRLILILAFLLAALMGAGVFIQPGPVRSTNGADAFDAAAAAARLTRVLSPEAPHPLDSDAEDRVRERLLAEIEALGFTPEIRDRFVCRPQPLAPVVDCGRVRNIVFSAGPRDGPIVLASTHYDSVPAAPGASDAGIGIAVWLEVARVLSQQDLTRRVVFLISDGEEPALLGAKSFVESDPLMAEIEAVVNLEARGTRGPAVFFETNQPNADAVRAFAASAPRPLANSIMSDIYRLMPNSTDVTVLSQEGIDVLNIALLEGVENYHTPQDNLASFNIRSLQHMGDIALGVTRRLATNVDTGSSESLAFTDIATRAFIAAPEWVGRVGLGFGIVFALAHFWLLGRDGRWKALAAPPLALAAGMALAFGAGQAISALRPGDYWLAHPEYTRAWCALLALFGIAFAVWRLGKTLRPQQAHAAAMFWFAALGLGGALVLPGLSILFTPTILLYAFGAIAGLFWKPAAPISSWLAALLTLLIWAPTLYLAELALGFVFPFATVGLAVLMLLPWLGVLVEAAASKSARSAALVLGVGAVACFVGALLVPMESLSRPRPLNILYFLDQSAGEARFLAGGAQRPLPTELASAAAFEPRRTVPGDGAASWSAPAPFTERATPRLEILSMTEEGGGRVLRARLVMNGAYRTSIRIPRTALPAAATLNGVEAVLEDASGAGDYIGIACQGRACEGAELSVRLEGPESEWLIVGLYPSAPDVAAELIAARPSSMTPIQNGDGMITLSRLRL